MQWTPHTFIVNFHIYVGFKCFLVYLDGFSSAGPSASLGWLCQRGRLAEMAAFLRDCSHRSAGNPSAGWSRAFCSFKWHATEILCASRSPTSPSSASPCAKSVQYSANLAPRWEQKWGTLNVGIGKFLVDINLAMI